MDRRSHNTLILHLPLDLLACKEPTVTWLHQTADTNGPSLQWRISILGELPHLTAATEIIVLIPAEWVLLTQVQIPVKQRKHLLQALPFLVEESLAIDVDTQHLAVWSQTGNTDTKIPVAVIDRALLDNILNLLQSYGLQVDRLLPDALTLPTPQPQEAYLLIDEQRLSLRTSAYHAISTDKDNLTTLLDSWREEYAPTSLQVLHTDTQLDDNIHLQLANSVIAHGIVINVHGEAIPAVNHSPADWQCDLNLLQGRFAPTKTKTASGINLKLPAMAASISITLYLGYLLASGLYFQIEANQHTVKAETLYRQYFPNDRRIVNIRTQTLNHMQEGQGLSNGSFVDMLSAFVQQWQSHQDITLQQIRFNRQRHEMLIELTSKTIVQLEQLRSQLQKSDLHSELLSATEEAVGVRGRLRLSKAQAGTLND